MKASKTPDEDEHVWLLTVKGNLRHRIEKCGIEKPCHEEATDPQRRLREVATAQHFEGKLGRPTWAKGAFVFVTVAHAASIQDAMQKWMTLQAVHCSLDLLNTILGDIEFFAIRAHGFPQHAADAEAMPAIDA